MSNSSGEDAWTDAWIDAPEELVSFFSSLRRRHGGGGGGGGMEAELMSTVVGQTEHLRQILWFLVGQINIFSWMCRRHGMKEH